MHEAQQSVGPVAGEGDASVGGLEADDAAVVGRLAYGAADIAADAERRHAGGHGRRLSAAGAAGRAPNHPGIFGATVNKIVGLPPEGELRHVGLGDEDASGVFQPGYDRRVGIGDMVFEQPGAAGRDHPGRIHAVLDGEWDTVERAPEFAAHCRSLGLAGALHDAFWEGDEGVEFRVDRLNTIEVGLNDLHR